MSAETTPGPPLLVSAVAFDQMAVVLFSPPLSDGHANITGYTATSTPGGIVGSSTSGQLMITVSGLSNYVVSLF